MGKLELRGGVENGWSCSRSTGVYILLAQVQRSEVTQSPLKNIFKKTAATVSPEHMIRCVFPSNANMFR